LPKWQRTAKIVLTANAGTEETMGRIAIAVAAVVAGLAVGLLAWRLIDERAAPPIVIDDPRLDALVVVAVQGAVSTPGTYRLNASSRVQDALVAAGGVSPHADVSAINPARRLRDEDLIFVPYQTADDDAAEIAGAASPPGTTGQAHDPADQVLPASLDQPLNLNASSAADLDLLPGIGPTLAKRIVEYRDAHGPFRTVDDIAEVQGISPRMVDDLRSMVTVGS